MKIAVTLSSRDHDAVLFDPDEVLTRTARARADIACYAGRLSRGSTLCRVVSTRSTAAPHRNVTGDDP